MPASSWADSPRQDVQARLASGALVAVATGALEQHGEHLPTGTDTLLADTVLRRGAELASVDVLLLPPLPFGISGYHARFGGTVWLSDSTFAQVITDIAASVRNAGGKALVIVNGHGGNRGILQAVGHRCSDVGFSLIPLNYYELAAEAARELFTEDRGPVGHAGQLETSLMLHVCGASLQPSADAAHEPIAKPDGHTIVDRLGNSGVIGSPAAGRAELGERFLDAVGDALASLLDSIASSR